MAENKLFPIFLKLEHLHVLIVGGGTIGLEKLTAILTNSPDATITLAARNIKPEIFDFQSRFNKLTIQKKTFEVSDLDGKDLVIAATGDNYISKLISEEAGKRKLLVNIADTPDLCDFYLGSIVQKGDLKIAISTNGKSPTFAKKLKEVFNETLSDDTQLSIDNLNKLRKHLKGDFTDRVKKMNEITSVLLSNSDH